MTTEQDRAKLQAHVDGQIREACRNQKRDRWEGIATRKATELIDADLWAWTLNTNNAPPTVIVSAIP